MTLSGQLSWGRFGEISRAAAVGRVQKFNRSRMLTAIKNEISGELVPEFIGIKRGGRTQKSALAARCEGLPETVDGLVRPMPRGRRFLNRLPGGFLGESGS